MSDSIYHTIFGMKKLRLCHFYATLLWSSLHNITKYINHYLFIDLST